MVTTEVQARPATSREAVQEHYDRVCERGCEHEAARRTHDGTLLFTCPACERDQVR